MKFERGSIACPRSKVLVLSIVCVSLALLLRGEQRASAQPDFRADLYGSQKLAKAAANKIAAKWNRKPLRVAVFMWGDDAGGMPEGEKQFLLDAYLRFNMELRKQANNRFTVLGPESIARELKARKTNDQDLSGIGFGQPKKVGEWLNTALNGEVQLALVGRKPKDGIIAELELVDLRGESERITAEEDGSVMHRWIHHPEESEFSKMTIIPELFLQVAGEKERRPVKLYSGGPGGASVAIVPSELRPQLGTGGVTLQIELNHSGKWPGMAMEGIKGYGLDTDPTRLCAVAVAIDGQSTLAEQRTHFITNKPLSVYPRLPAEQLRKWLVAQPGHVVVPNGNTFRVDKLKQGVGHGRIPIIGFQEDSESARLFTLCSPAEGAAEAAGIHSSPGVIWITAFAEKKPADKVQALATGSDSAIPLRMGMKVPNAVNSFDVYCYNNPIEEHVILLRMSDKDDPKKEEFRKPYPPVPPLPVTN